MGTETVTGAGSLDGQTGGVRRDPTSPDYRIVVQPDKALVRPLYVVDFIDETVRRRR